MSQKKKHGRIDRNWTRRSGHRSTVERKGNWGVKKNIGELKRGEESKSEMFIIRWT